ncbi:hypothetical protein BP6252_10672 [Coleophoma cylindrospora]|uniref:Uncharacterized protein n=1 Tax=Coleophoma cylindrospora TaxID=1849047 RepID=A0A3D8QTK1_9HELO|nr:hypothetical protein BP6252_10672 [Coleophoma cylindrospora]
MVKHQRRSHQRGIHSSELDDGETSDSDSGESPSTPQHSGQMQWSQGVHPHLAHGHQMHRAHSFADFGQQQDAFHMQQYGHRHSLSGGAPQYPTIHEHPNHHPGHMMHRNPSLQTHSSYYVPEQNNPGVATLNTNPAPIQTYQIPRQQGAQEMLQSSPSSYSSASRASPVSQEPYYTHHPAQTATYALHSQHNSPVDQQPMVHYQQQLPQQHPMPTPIPQAVQVPEPYHQQPQGGQWYENVAYQPPVEVISHIGHPYGQNNVFHDPWAQKLEAFDDPSLQMPSARIENL